MHSLEDPEEDREDTAEVNVNTTRAGFTDSWRTDMSDGVQSPRRSKHAEDEG